MTELYFKDEVYRIVGAAMEVQDELGSGLSGHDEAQVPNYLKASRKKRK